MSTPELPMRERIAEALGEHGGWYTLADEGSFCDCHHHLAPAGVSAVKAWEAHRADAVLAVLADLPDTVVEAGAEEVRGHVKYLGHCYDGATGRRLAFCTSCDWDHIADADDVDAAFAKHHTRAVLTATIAAFKEGKA